MSRCGSGQTAEALGQLGEARKSGLPGRFLVSFQEAGNWQRNDKPGFVAGVHFSGIQITL